VDQPFSERWLIVPTDSGDKLRPQTQTDITLVLVWFVICFVNLVLLFAHHSFSKATIELVSLL